MREYTRTVRWFPLRSDADPVRIGRSASPRQPDRAPCAPASDAAAGSAGRRPFSSVAELSSRRRTPGSDHHPRPAPHSLFPFAAPPTRPRTAPVDLSRVARFCDFVWRPATLAAGFRPCFAQNVRDPAGLSDPAPSAAGPSDRREDVWDQKTSKLSISVADLLTVSQEIPLTGKKNYAVR